MASWSEVRRDCPEGGVNEVDERALSARRGPGRDRRDQCSDSRPGYHFGLEPGHALAASSQSLLQGRPKAVDLQEHLDAQTAAR